MKSALMQRDCRMVFINPAIYLCIRIAWEAQMYGLGLASLGCKKLINEKKQTYPTGSVIQWKEIKNSQTKFVVFVNHTKPLHICNSKGFNMAYSQNKLLFTSPPHLQVNLMVKSYNSTEKLAEKIMWKMSVFQFSPLHLDVWVVVSEKKKILHVDMGTLSFRSRGS